MNKKGFTLIELIIVIAIISILSAIALPKVSKYIEMAEKAKLQSDFETVYLAINSAIATNINMPILHNSTESIENGEKVVNFSYMKRNWSNYSNLFANMESYFPSNKKIIIADDSNSPLDYNFTSIGNRDPVKFALLYDRFESAGSINVEDDYFVPIYFTNDSNADTFALTFIYYEYTNRVNHIILANEGYISIDGGELIEMNPFNTLLLSLTHNLY